MSAALQRSLALLGRDVTALEAERCYASRDLFDPVDVCLKWKAAEESLMKKAPRASMEDILESNMFEVGRASIDKSPCLVIHAKQQNPATYPCSVSLLSTLWACDAAMASGGSADAKLIVGYDFEGAGVHNFSFETALAFSRLFLNEYPCLVKDIYLIKMPWLLKRLLLPLFKPLVSHRVSLIPVEGIEEFANHANYEVIAGQSATRSTRLSNHIEKEVPRAAAWMRGTWEQQHEQKEEWSHNRDISQIAYNFSRTAFGFASPWFSSHGSTSKSASQFVAQTRPHILVKVLPLETMLCRKLELLFSRSNESKRQPFDDTLVYNQAFRHGFAAMLFSS